MKTDKSERAYRRHKLILKLAYWPARIVAYLKFRFTCEAVRDLPTPFILVSNHVTDLDPIFVGIAIRDHMYYVASEHIYRQGFISKLLKWAVEPIARVKGSTDASSAMHIIRTLRRGKNVCIFAEGDRTWNGVTCPVHPSTARLIKASKASLVTYRLTGGYLTSPRWSTEFRKGKMSGSVVNIYSPETIKAMSDEELMNAMESDISADAYGEQAASPVLYKGKRLAERLENALYICPECDGVCTMKSEDNRFYCTECGAASVYTESGSLEGMFAFKNVLDWDRWQDGFLQGYSLREGTLYSDGVQSLSHVSDHATKVVETGEMKLDGEKLSVGNAEFPVEQISAVSLIRSKSLVFTAQNENYEIHMENGSARKYYTMINILKSRHMSREG